MSTEKLTTFQHEFENSLSVTSSAYIILQSEAQNIQLKEQEGKLTFEWGRL